MDSLQTTKIGKEKCAPHVSRWPTDSYRPPHRLSHLNSNPSTKRERQPKTLKVCCLHPGSRTHFVDKCRDFLDMPTAERWQVAKKNNLCFNCLSSAHYTKQCLTKQNCNKCERFHHRLLHEPLQSTKQLPRKSQPSCSSVKPANSVAGNKDSTAKIAAFIGVDRPEEQLPEHVDLMVLTAIKRDGSGDVRERMEFCAAVDTGATRTLCSRKTAERLFHTWQPSECKRYKMFHGDLANYKVRGSVKK